jgi:hypothetical protein
MVRQRAGWPVAIAWFLAATVVSAQPPWAGGPPGRRGPDPAAAEDRALFHDLIENRAAIRRSVTEIDDGVETLTESDDPAVREKIVRHVHAMKARIDEGRPIHRRDPLFAALFEHADDIRMDVTETPRGARVREVSSDPYVTKLIRAHADVVSRFLSEGWSEMRRDHPVPPR